MVFVDGLSSAHRYGQAKMFYLEGCRLINLVQVCRCHL